MQITTTPRNSRSRDITAHFYTCICLLLTTAYAYPKDRACTIYKTNSLQMEKVFMLNKNDIIHSFKFLYDVLTIQRTITTILQCSLWVIKSQKTNVPSRLKSEYGFTFHFRRQYFKCCIQICPLVRCHNLDLMPQFFF